MGTDAILEAANKFQTRLTVSVTVMHCDPCRVKRQRVLPQSQVYSQTHEKNGVKIVNHKWWSRKATLTTVNLIESSQDKLQEITEQYEYNNTTSAGNKRCYATPCGGS